MPSCELSFVLANVSEESPVGRLFAAVEQSPAVQSLVRRMEKGGFLYLSQVSRGAQPFLTMLLRRVFPAKPIVVVTDGLKAQESFQQDLETWQALTRSNPQDKQPPKRSLFFYPGWEILPHEAKLPHVDVISERLETLMGLSAWEVNGGEAPIVNTNVVALLQKTFPPQTLRGRMRDLKRGDQVNPLDLVEWLEDQGYEPEAQVNNKGEIALRGGILDIFPPISPWPIRLEFFGDELESLRFFDPISQMSREEIPSTSLSPAGELGILKRSLLLNQNAGQEPPPLATLLEYLPNETIFLLCEPEQLEHQATTHSEMVPENDPFFVDWDDLLASIRERKFGGLEIFEAEADAFPAFDEAERTREDSEGEQSGKPLVGEKESAASLALSSLDAFRPLAERAPDPQVAEAQRREFFAQLHRWARQGFGVHVFCNNGGERERFGEIWKEYGFDDAPLGEDGVGLFTHTGALTRGFLDQESRKVVVTDAEIFGRYKVQRARRLKSPHAQTSRSLLDINFTELQEGDFVVHLQHGIARYQGLGVLPPTVSKKQKETETNELGQECLILEYAPTDPTQPAPKLYVPVTEAHLVSKYVGAGKARPQLNTLGGGRWAKAKEQAERAVRDLAGELLSIQAARDSLEGHPFPQDTTWQREFESSFLFEETPDQMKAIVQTKADMEKPKPMDRLICGDVGYGKTEIAIRAAFKAVMGGRQVAILVPTTVLAQQHYNTFRERMADYPVRVDLLSRFRTGRDQKRIIREMADGSIDIIIGTHRLVQGDIAFKELGLVIIDEEQRFGVMHKERFKLMRKLVDVLTLSATPIPRTLYLALTGARDMSTIETPPQDRLPVETIVTQFDERVIRDAVVREVNRGGQVFYLHNRVHDIEAVALRLKALVPQARIVVGHGQLHADDLEEVMTKFVNGEADVLLSTTIIESGLDIPNANTIIIDRADRFGLSELYQLRGRVGRYKHQAYAYLLLPRHAGLLSDARKRISAIKQYSTLGSGFKIAMRDLEIRGAGNLLGSQQSGHITAVGFDLYCQLLKQSVSQLKGEKVKPRVEVQVRLDFLSLNPVDEAKNIPAKTARKAKEEPALSINIPRETASYTSSDESFEERRVEVPKGHAYIPMNYVQEPQQRVEIYRKLAEINEAASVEKLRVELRDRFGTLPPAMELLLQVSALKILAARRGITAIETRGEKLMLTRNNDYVTLGGKFPRLVKTEVPARLKEIKKLLLAYPES
jgi:transcription-repair coupling factor (superfamily II helicase)